MLRWRFTFLLPLVQVDHLVCHNLDQTNQPADLAIRYGYDMAYVPDVIVFALKVASTADMKRNLLAWR